MPLDAMASSKIRFPKQCSDGSAVVDVFLDVPALPKEKVCSDLKSWVSRWYATAPVFTMLGRSFDPATDLLAAPEVIICSDAVVLRLRLRRASYKFWKDWFVMDLHKRMKSLLPGLVLLRFESPSK
jgi:hypothetical protein